ncbi:Protein of unknown function [Bacillus mobilis]|nr:Protein of unknown function [Bacillus mobilis]
MSALIVSIPCIRQFMK